MAGSNWPKASMNSQLQCIKASQNAGNITCFKPYGLLHAFLLLNSIELNATTAFLQAPQVSSFTKQLGFGRWKYVESISGRPLCPLSLGDCPNAKPHQEPKNSLRKAFRLQRETFHCPKGASRRKRRRVGSLSAAREASCASLAAGPGMLKV